MKPGDRLRQALRDGPLVLDGPMGTRLRSSLGFSFAHTTPCQLNLTHPDAVLAVHRDDVAAGSEVLTANTFDAHPHHLEKFGRKLQVAEIIRQGVRIAREAAGPERFVLGSIGDFSSRSSPNCPSFHAEQSTLLAEAGADGILLETHAEQSALVGLRHCLEVVSLPVFVSLHAWPDHARDLARRFEDLGASVIGSNCGLGLADVVRQVERIAGATQLPLLAKPSVNLDGDLRIPPDAVAKALSGLEELGVRLMGVCCGGNPLYLAAIVGALAKPMTLLGDSC